MSLSGEKSRPLRGSCEAAPARLVLIVQLGQTGYDCQGTSQGANCRATTFGWIGDDLGLDHRVRAVRSLDGQFELADAGPADAAACQPSRALRRGFIRSISRRSRSGWPRICPPTTTTPCTWARPPARRASSSNRRHQHRRVGHAVARPVPVAGRRRAGGLSQPVAARRLGPSCFARRRIPAEISYHAGTLPVQCDAVFLLLPGRADGTQDQGGVRSPAARRDADRRAGPTHGRPAGNMSAEALRLILAELAQGSEICSAQECGPQARWRPGRGSCWQARIAATGLAAGRRPR